MKLKYLILLLLPLLLTGCTRDFFDIQESMQNPKLSKENKSLVETASKYLGNKFDFSFHFVNNRYCATTQHEFENGKTYKMMFCQPENNPEKVYILFLKEDPNQKWKVFADIVSSPKEIDKIYLKDINDDGVDEILICKNDGTPTTDVYQISESGTKKIQSFKENI